MSGGSVLYMGKQGHSSSCGSTGAPYETQQTYDKMNVKTYQLHE